MSSVESGKMCSVETLQISVVETGQMFPDAPRLAAGGCCWLLQADPDHEIQAAFFDKQI